MEDTIRKTDAQYIINFLKKAAKNQALIEDYFRKISHSPEETFFNEIELLRAEINRLQSQSNRSREVKYNDEPC